MYILIVVEKGEGRVRIFHVMTRHTSTHSRKLRMVKARRCNFPQKLMQLIKHATCLAAKQYRAATLKAKD